MKKALLALALLSAGFTLGHAQIIISEVDSAGSGSSYGADWFELTNTGSSAVNISGWRMDDDSDSFGSGVALSLAGNVINPGQSVVFIETTDVALSTSLPAFEAAWFPSGVPSNFTVGTYGGSKVGLSQSGDQVNIFNASGTHITGVSFGAPVGSATFDNTAGLSGAISTPSVAGVNDAVTARNGEIGSPGVDAAVVPEPSTYALLVGGLLALVGIQMRRRSVSNL